MPYRICSLICAIACVLAAETIDLGGGATLAVALVPAGEVRLGSPVEEAGRGADEAQRLVRITRPFRIGCTPVTRGQFARFVAVTGYRTEAEVGSSGGWGLVGQSLAQQPGFTWRNPGFAQDDRHPVVLVTWADAQAFCAWVTRLGHGEATLPSEAEWECACRGGPGGGWNATVPPSRTGTSPVGGAPANPIGLTDLIGSVNQWCRDWYAVQPDQRDRDPEVSAATGTPPRRCLRGGSFLGSPERNRPAARWRNAPGSRNADNGFRIIVRDLLVEPPAPR